MSFIALFSSSTKCTPRWKQLISISLVKVMLESISLCFLKLSSKPIPKVHRLRFHWKLRLLLILIPPLLSKEPLCISSDKLWTFLIQIILIKFLLSSNYVKHGKQLLTKHRLLDTATVSWITSRLSLEEFFRTTREYLDTIGILKSKFLSTT
mgnify:CR=1 FL=1